MRSGGRSKSKVSTRMEVLVPSPASRERAAGGPLSRDPGQARGGEGASAQRRLHDLVGIADGFAALDLVDVFHARNNLAPDRVLPIEKGGVAKADEELRIGRVWA